MNSQELMQIIELYELDSLIRIITLYYLFKVCNVAFLIMNNALDMIFSIWKSFKGDK